MRPSLLIFALAAGCGVHEPAATELPPRLSWSELDRRGDTHLKAGRFAEAIADFDAAIAGEPELAPFHWRRGIALYYAGRFGDGVRQFELHRTVNPDDVENAVWHFLCRARLDGLTAARAALLPVGPDPRVPMRTVYELFAGRATADDVERAAAAGSTGQDESPLFYAHLYLGLYHETQGALAAARRHIDLAAGRYRSPHYMGDVARVHAEQLARARK